MWMFDYWLKMGQITLQARATQWQLYTNTIRTLIDAKPRETVTEQAGDPRFKHPAWKRNPWLSYWRQRHLLTAYTYLSFAALNGKSLPAKQHRFVLRQWLNAGSPHLIPWLNPEVIDETIKTRGQNLLSGAIRFTNDLAKTDLPTVEKSVFKAGENIANAAGVVVSRNSICELLYYPAQAKSDAKTPVLISPPPINKFYILDINTQKSLVQFLTRSGRDVYMLSWRNPSSQTPNFYLQDYLSLGLHDAVNKVLSQQTHSHLHLAGYCLGGTLASMYLGSHLAKNTPVSSVTLLATLLDFEHSGECGIFMNDAMLQRLKLTLANRAVVSGKSIAYGFRWLRPNHLIWPYMIDNYLLNKPLSMFDIMYWNSDTTNLPTHIYLQYIQSCYVDNVLTSPRGYQFGNIQGKLQNINCPAYVVGTEDDHITPWHGVFNSAQLLNGETTFVLSSSGHILGIVNPPSSTSKRRYTRASISPGESPQTWQKRALSTTNSWWPHWLAWLQSHDQSQLNKPANQTLTPIQPAPGSYILP